MPYAPLNPVDEVVLYDLVKPGLREIRVEYMPPSFSESKSANYAQVPILGRSEPLLGYQGSGPRVFTITLHFASMGQDPWTDVIKPIQLIRSWLYPDYTQDLPNIPPRVLFVVGAWLSSRCVAARADVTYHAPWGRLPFSRQAFSPGSAGGAERDSMVPYWAEVNLVLQEVTENSNTTPWDHYDIDTGADVI